MRPTRKATRLAEFDYGSVGAYFVTICAYGSRPVFGAVQGGQFKPSGLGYLITDHWHRIPRHYDNVRLDQFIAMPNHLHGIVFILQSDGSRIAKSLSSIVGGLKSGVVREARNLGIHGEGLLFQSRFYDHVVRHERALERIREYIANNPLQWSLDRENPERTGLNEFYKWLENYSRQVQAKNTEGQGKP